MITPETIWTDAWMVPTAVIFLHGAVKQYKTVLVSNSYRRVAVITWQLHDKLFHIQVVRKWTIALHGKVAITLSQVPPRQHVLHQNWEKYSNIKQLVNKHELWSDKQWLHALPSQVQCYIREPALSAEIAVCLCQHFLPKFETEQMLNGRMHTTTRRISVLEVDWGPSPFRQLH